MKKTQKLHRKKNHLILEKHKNYIKIKNHLILEKLVNYKKVV
jgi:hypothetical protein